MNINWTLVEERKLHTPGHEYVAWLRAMIDEVCIAHQATLLRLHTLLNDATKES